jgi:hypothetical protein
LIFNIYCGRGAKVRVPRDGRLGFRKIAGSQFSPPYSSKAEGIGCVRLKVL